MSAAEKETKFFNRASIGGGGVCWLWQGARSGSGYGYITMRRNKRKWNLLAHRVAKEIAIGRSLSKEENIHHTCEELLCVNPNHLVIVARRDHPQHHRITRCKRGHELAGDNLHVTAEGHYVCIACRRLRDSENRKRRRLTDPAWREQERLRSKAYHDRRRGNVSE